MLKNINGSGWMQTFLMSRISIQKEKVLEIYKKFKKVP